MATGLFAILDDIAVVMDDVAAATKIAARKTAGILGDDLAVNAEKATGFLATREIPVLWSITKGSFVNKLIIVPSALLLNAFFPAIVKIILILGGVFLAYEGVEKIIEYFFHRSKVVLKTAGTVKDDVAAEKAKIKSAIATDFVLSLEIIIIALGSAAKETLTTQIATVVAVAILATVGVYGVVAVIIRLDDAGYKLIRHSNNTGFLSIVGTVLVSSLPVIIRIMAFVGTIALLMVAGDIFVHNINFFHHVFPQVHSVVKEFAFALVAGLLVFFILAGGKKLLSFFKR